MKRRSYRTFLFLAFLGIFGSCSLAATGFAERCGYTWKGAWHQNSHGYSYQEEITCTLSEHEERFRYTEDNKHEVYIVHEGYYSTSTGNYPRSCTQVLSEEECSPVSIAGYTATCTKAGLTDGIKCAFCGHMIQEQQEIPIKGHTRVVDQYLAPTCTEDGHTVGAHCSECGSVLLAYDILPATGHTIVTDAAVPPTCTETGLTEGSHCSVCEETIVAQELIPALGHTKVVDSEGIPATCTEEGMTEGAHCSVCNVVLSAAEVVPATAS